MTRAAVLVMLGAVAGGCTSNVTAPTAPMSVPVFTQSETAAEQANGANFGTPMSPDEEVMPAGVTNMSRARGSAVFQLSADGTSMTYQLMVANIENAFMAHIHRQAPGFNGPVVVWLYPSTATTPGPVGAGRLDGVIASGTITAAHLVGPLLGQPLSALVNEIKAGNTYVNVHTNDGVDPPNTGPGDYPGGEVRGQIEHRGH